MSFTAPSLASLPPTLHGSFLHMLQRLQRLQCPLLSQLSGSGGSGGAVDIFAHGSIGLELLQSADDSTLQRSAAAAQLSLRLALFQWMVARYDSDLPRLFIDLAAEYADQKANQTMLAQFKRQDTYNTSEQIVLSTVAEA